MLSDDKRKELTSILRGDVIKRQGCNLTAARNYLCKSFSTSKKVEKNFEQQSRIKEKQRESLISFIEQSQLWVNDIAEQNYLTEGGEAKVYFNKAAQSVIKLNDAVYYNTWLDYLNSILIHNLFFERTSYTLVGFLLKETTLYAVLAQQFIVSDQPTDLSEVKAFLEFNGFENTRRNDYYNKELGLILEDMHDENVLTNSNTLFFVDTVFYINL